MFLPPVIAFAMGLAVMAQWWVFFEHGLSGGMTEVLDRPAGFHQPFLQEVL